MTEVALLCQRCGGVLDQWREDNPEGQRRAAYWERERLPVLRLHDGEAAARCQCREQTFTRLRQPPE